MCRLLPYRKEEGHEGKKRTELLENGFIIPRLSQGGEHFGLFRGDILPGTQAAEKGETSETLLSMAVVCGHRLGDLAAEAVTLRRQSRMTSLREDYEE